MNTNKTEPMRLSDIEALIENIVRKQAPAVADGWFWGSPEGGGGARGADGRTLFAYWQTEIGRHDALISRMAKVREAIESLDGVESVRVHECEPDTALTGPPLVGEQWEIHLNIDVAGPS
jgi:hypothetical protein